MFLQGMWGKTKCKKYSETKSQINKQKYTTVRDLYFYKVCEAKQNYFKVLFAKNRNNIKNTWASINLLLNKHSEKVSRISLYCDNQDKRALPEVFVDVANHFKEYFSKVASNLVKKLPNTNIRPTSHAKGTYPDSIASCTFITSFKTT